MKNKYYITTPIYYVNDVPHIGHAYTTIAADVLARHYKSLGRDVFFMTGTDEHGAKIAEAAKKAGKKPKEFVDGLVPEFEKAWEALDIKYDKFFRTTDAEHEKFVQAFILKLKNDGYIEKKEYKGLYCLACERYYMPDELDDGKCPFHGTVPVEQSEENYFFLLSKAAKDKHLYEEIESEKRIKVRPETRKNEVLSKIKNGLEDVSISRAGVDWGIPFPEDPKQTVYVWVDALLNYLSATEIYEDGPTWPADLHLMAKDILWFHAIIWPAMLLAAGYELPKMVYAHGFFTIEGKKMSKSLGNAIDPNYLVKKYGRDAVRYAILREFPFGEDGDISEDKIANRYTADLANGLGNLLNRTLSMINRYELDVENATPLKLTDVGKSPDEDTISTYIENLNFSEALSDIWTCYIKPSNELIDKKKPWELIKTDKEETESVLRFCYDNLLTIKSSIEPFMPEIAQKMGDQLETKKPDPLFPRLES